jgi:hypothetical protein
LVNNGLALIKLSDGEETAGDSGEPNGKIGVEHRGERGEVLEGVGDNKWLCPGRTVCVVEVKVRVKCCSPSSTRQIEMIICAFVCNGEFGFRLLLCVDWPVNRSLL